MKHRHSRTDRQRPTRSSPSWILMLALTMLVAVGFRSSPSVLLELDAAQRETTSGHDRVDEEDEDPGSDGILLDWRLPSKGETRLETPWLELELRNLDAATYDIQLRTLEDAGSMQSRRMAAPVSGILGDGSSLTMQLPFADGVAAELTHSGMVVAHVTACPRNGGRCISGQSEPVFFHPDRGGYLVYDEQLLCRRHNCGALTARIEREPGTWRVMGGGPLHDTTSREEPDGDDDGIVDGGEI